MRRFLAFCPELGLLEGIRLPHVDVEVPLSTLRTDIISPSEAASLWKRLTYAGVDGSTRQMYALVIALGCYGGLRISEIASLTLKDVQLEPLMSFATPFNGDRSVTHDESEGEGGEEKAAPLACWILVLDGKSEAARRRIPLHVLSPRRVIPMLQRWVEERKRQCPGRPLDQIALFGPRGNPDAYQKEVLSRETITLLREEMGEHVDFHSLRHAAASWLILRLHAAQSADFLQSLCYQYDEIFTRPGYRKRSRISVRKKVKTRYGGAPSSKSWRNGSVTAMPVRRFSTMCIPYRSFTQIFSRRRPGQRQSRQASTVRAAKASCA